MSKESVKSSEVKKAITKENSAKSVTKGNRSNIRNGDMTKDLKLQSSEIKRKELRTNGTKFNNSNVNITPREDNRKVSTKGDNHETNGVDNSVLSKLRKRKIDSMSPQVNGESTNHSVVITSKSGDKANQETPEVTKEAIRTKPPEDEPIDEQIEIVVQKKVESVPDIDKPVNGTEPMETEPLEEETAEPMQVSVKAEGLCIVSDCKAKVNPFHMFEGHFCSAKCAIKQWTDDFHNHWGLKNSP